MEEGTKNTMLKMKREVDRRLELFLKKEVKKAKRIDKSFTEATKMVADFTLRGGKRVRAGLMYYGYLAAGGSRKEAIWDASLSMELGHSFLLIHDDIIDNDNFRRGKPTLHKEYAKLFWKLGIKDPEKVGQSLAITCGDIAYTLANKILCQSSFPSSRKVKAITRFQKMINDTIAGEIMDITAQIKKGISVKKILKIYKYKTARYTIEGPLIIGAILAGAGPEIKKALANYAVLLGVSFQIHDDLKGIFGSPKELGKDLGSDLREGKKTLLTQKTYCLASNEQRELLKSFLGKGKITKKEIKAFQKITQDCGSLEYCQSIVHNLSLKAKEIILNSPIKGEARDFFLESADYITKA